MEKTTFYENLQGAVAKTEKKIEEVKALIAAIEGNFLSIGLKEEVWLADKIYEKNLFGIQTQYFLGCVPSGNPGIRIQSFVRDTATEDILESRTEALTSIENASLLKAATDRLYSLLTEANLTIRRNKEKAFEINTKALEELASKDFGKELL